MAIAEQNALTEFEQNGSSKVLVVVVHAFTLGRKHLRDVVDVIREQLPDADIYLPEYPAGLFSNTDLGRIAFEISTRIVELERDRARRLEGKPYEEIILVGHSLGALPVRMAYLIARGRNLGHIFGRLGIQAKPEP